MDDGCRRQLCVANCGQTAADSDIVIMAAYKHFQTPYPTVPSPTFYDVPFSHGTKRYRRQTDRQTDGRTDDTSYHKRDR